MVALAKTLSDKSRVILGKFAELQNRVLVVSVRDSLMVERLTESKYVSPFSLYCL